MVRSNWTRLPSFCTTRRRSSRDSRPTDGPTGQSSRFDRRPMRRDCAPRPAGSPFRNCPTKCSWSRCENSSPSTTSGCPPPVVSSRCICGRSSSRPNPASGCDRRWSTAIWLSPRRRGRISRAASSRSVCGCPPSMCVPVRVVPAPPSSAVTTRPHCSRSPRLPRTAAIRWCGWMPSSVAISKRWAG